MTARLAGGVLGLALALGGAAGQGAAQEGTSFAGLPPGTWRTIENWQPGRVILDCGAAAAQDACQHRDLTDGAPLERAIGDAMRWMQGEGIFSPDRLGPVVTLGPSGTSALMVFSRALEDALAEETSCLAAQDNRRAVALSFNLVPDLYASMPTPEEGHAGLQVVPEPGAPGGAIASPVWQMQGLAAHELAHAVQDSTMHAAAGLGETCDPEGVYRRARFLFEGLADFMKITLVRWHLSPDGRVARQMREMREADGTVADLLPNGLSQFEFRKLHGWAYYSSGLFHERNAYLSSSFFRHLAERFHDGQAALHNVFFDPASAVYPGAEITFAQGGGRMDLLEWFAQMVDQRLGLEPFGPALALAFADIGSWPDTSYDGRQRIMPIGYPGAALWRHQLLGCRQFRLAPDDPEMESDGGVAPYAGQCLEFYIDQAAQAGHLAHNELMLELTAPTLREADGMHLGLIQIIQGKAKDHLAERQVKTLDPPDPKRFSVVPATLAPPRETRLFACAEALDSLPIDTAHPACVPLRDGPVRQPDGRYRVRWTLPMPVVSDGQTASVVLTYVPTRTRKGIGPLPQEEFVGGARARLSLRAALRSTADLDAEESALGAVLRDALRQSGGAPPVAACDETMPRGDVPDIRPITRAFGHGDWNRFDFPDDIRSDFNSAVTRERMQGAGVPMLFPFAAATWVDDGLMIQRLGAFQPNDAATVAIIDQTRDGAGDLMGFAIEISEQGWCHGRTDDDTLGKGADPRSYFAYFADFSAGDAAVAREHRHWAEMTPGAQFDVALTVATPGTPTPTGLGAGYDRGKITVLGRGADWVRLRFVLGGETLPQRRFEAVLPFVGSYTWHSDAVVEETAMQRYYLERWKAEEMLERAGLPIDGMGRETAPRRPPTQAGQAGTSGGAATATGHCSCERLSSYATHLQNYGEPPVGFAITAGECCPAFRGCGATAREEVQRLLGYCVN